MIDLVDSSRDPAGKQYRAGLIRPVDIGNGVVIAQGSAGTVVLVKNGSAWNVQLSSLVIKGQVTMVTSNPGTVIGAATQNNMANAANTVLGSFGRKPNLYPPAAVVASGERVMLTPGITLSFVLNPVPVVPDASPAAASAPSSPAPVSTGQGIPAQAQQPEKWFYCYNTVPMPPNSMSKQFVSGVFQSDGDPAAIGVAWDMYIANTYAPVNKKDLLDTNTYHPPHCATNARITLQQMHDSDVKGGVTTVDWKYAPRQEFQQAQVPKPVTSAGQNAPAQAQKQQGGGWWWWCQSGQYMTGVFFYPADITTRVDVDSAIQAAWRNHVTREYPHENLATGCNLGGTDQASTRRVYDHVRAGQKDIIHKDIVDVDWKYVPGQDTPVVASGPGRLWYCSASFGPTDENVAFSNSFEAPKGTNTNMVRDDFVKFVSEKYSAKAEGSCLKGDDNDKAKAEKDESTSIWHKKIVETGWKPTRLPKADLGH